MDEERADLTRETRFLIFRMLSNLLQRSHDKG